MVGWKTAGWNGDYYAPGFVFDAAQVTYWVANTDYRIGDSVEYQGKFYVAKINHNSGATFEKTNWTLKDEKERGRGSVSDNRRVLVPHLGLSRWYYGKSPRGFLHQNQ